MLSLCLCAPAAAAPPASAQAVSPWVLMSAVASPSSGRELCKDRRRDQETAEQRRKRDRECALPIGAEGQAGAYGAAGNAAKILPLTAGLAALAGITAYLLARGDGGDKINLPISPQ